MHLERSKTTAGLQIELELQLSGQLVNEQQSFLQARGKT
jgi:hypothetical protein